MILWEDRYETGIPAVDMHHRVLVRTFNEFERALETHQIEIALLKELLLFLKHYADWHFAREEEIAECYACPVAEKNRRAHEGFIHHFQERFRQLKELSGDPTTLHSFARILHQELSQWLVSHVLNVDQQIGHCVHAHRGHKDDGDPQKEGHS
jgi:hemerythrin